MMNPYYPDTLKNPKQESQVIFTYTIEMDDGVLLWQLANV